MAVIKQVSGALGTGLRNTDWYSFTLAGMQTVDLDLWAAPGKATLFLYNSSFANGPLSGQLAAQPAGAGGDAVLGWVLAAGTYYVGVASALDEHYTLSLTTGAPAVGSVSTRLAGTTAAAARDLGVPSTPGTAVAEWVGPGNADDWYAFTATTPATIGITLAGTSRATTVILRDAAGKEVARAVTATVSSTSGPGASILAAVAPGAYTIDVQNLATIGTGYNLALYASMPAAIATSSGGAAASSPGGPAITAATTLGLLTAGAGTAAGAREPYGIRAALITTDDKGNHFVAPAASPGIADGAGATGALQFIDGRLVFDPADAAAQVTRLYRAALGRPPDQAGLVFWTAQLQRGVALDALARSFIASDEFNARYGGLDDTGFVVRLYQNVLGRAPDAGGQAFWVGSIGAGSARAGVLGAFSESTENKAATAGLVAAGIWVPDPNAAEVARLYDTVFARKPDLPGLTGWTSLLAAGSATALQVTDAMMASPEFRGQYGGLSNAAFVQALYANTLGRPADPGGLAFWTAGLDRAPQSRAAVVLAFSDSAEHIARTAPTIGGELPSQRGILFA